MMCICLQLVTLCSDTSLGLIFFPCSLRKLGLCFLPTSWAQMPSVPIFMLPFPALKLSALVLETVGEMWQRPAISVIKV